MNKLKEIFSKVKLFFYLSFKIIYLFLFKKPFFIWRRPKTYLNPNYLGCMLEIQKKAKEEWANQWPKEYVKIRDGQLTTADFPSKELNPYTEKELERVSLMADFVKKNRKPEDRANNMEIVKKLQPKNGK